MSSLLDQAREGLPLAGGEIIDMHGHLGPIDFAVPDISPDTLVRSMDRLGVRHVICSSMHCMSSDAEYGNDDVLAAMRRRPGRILGYVSLFPSGADSVRREVERRLAEGFTGLKLHNCNGFGYLDPAYEPAYAIADARRLPVLFHTWGQAREMTDIREVSKRYPEASLLLAHSGTGDQEEYFRIARECENVYCELAYSVSPRGLVKRLVDEVGADKIVWGSDVYFFSELQQIGKVIGARIDEADKLKILAGNARRILGRIVSGC